MKIQKALTTAAMLALSVTFVTGCSKSEPAVSAASPTSSAIASAPAAPPEAAPATELQPAPDAPVATFTPKSDAPAPMLPTLDSLRPAVDEHGHSTSTSDVRRIAPEEAAMLVQSGDAIILDVRSPEAFAARHIKGSVNIPLEQVAGRARAELPLTRWIIPYCT